MNSIRKWSRLLHRDLSYFFAGVIIIYSISGVVLNHKRTFNSNYSVERTEITLQGAFPTDNNISRGQAEAILQTIDPNADYVKHYAFGATNMKIFLSGGSSIDVDMSSGKAIYEKLTKRHIISAFTRLHYNPSRWWTYFSDAFCVALVIITITGLIMIRGRYGLWGRGGVELLLGIAVPIAILLLL